MPLPKYPIPQRDPQGLSNLNANFAYHEQKTDAMQAPPFVVDSEEEMLALPAVIGNTCIRTDLTAESQQFILTALPASVLGNWMQMPMPLSPVDSVNGMLGAVSLNAANLINPDTENAINVDLGNIKIVKNPINPILTEKYSVSNSQGYYTIDSLGRKSVQLWLRSNAEIAHGDIMMTLPEGYRPQPHTVFFLTLYTASGNRTGMATADAKPSSGELVITQINASTPIPSSSFLVVGQCTYL